MTKKKDVFDAANRANKALEKINAILKEEGMVLKVDHVIKIIPIKKEE